MRMHLLRGFGLLLGSFILLAGCSTTTTVSPEVEAGLQAHQFFTQGMAAYQAQDYQAALPFFQQALRIDPAMDEAMAALAWSDYHLGAYRESTYVFRQALLRQPRWKDLYDGLGWSRYHLGRYALATEAFQQALQLDLGYRDARVGLAFAEFEMGDYADARPQLHRLVREGEGTSQKSPAPDEEEVRGRLAWTLFYLKDYDQAVAEFRRGIAAHPEAYNLYDGLGWTDLALGQPRLALENFAEALRLKPDFRDAEAGMRLAQQG